MQKKEFFGALLLVALVSSIMLSGFVSSGMGPRITVNPTWGTGDSRIDWIKGTGWVPFTPVITLYWDQENLNHTIANVTADRFGKFQVEDLEVEGSFIGAHTIIAVQGLSTATAVYTMKVTTTPDDRILGPLQQLEDKLDNTTSALQGIQSNFTTVLNNIAAIENKLDNTTSGLPGVQSNLTKIDSDVNAVEDKLDPNGRLGNTTQFAAEGGEFEENTTAYGEYTKLSCDASDTAEFTVTAIAVHSDNPASDKYYIWASFDGVNWDTLVDNNFNTPGSPGVVTMSITARDVIIGVATSGYAKIDCGISVQYGPGVTLSWGP